MAARTLPLNLSKELDLAQRELGRFIACSAGIPVSGRLDGPVNMCVASQLLWGQSMWVDESMKGSIVFCLGEKKSSRRIEQNYSAKCFFLLSGNPASSALPLLI